MRLCFILWRDSNVMPHEFMKYSLGEKIMLEAFVEYRDKNGKK